MTNPWSDLGFFLRGQHGGRCQGKRGSPSVDSVHSQNLPPQYDSTLPSVNAVPNEGNRTGQFFYTNKYILRDTRIEVNHSTTPYYNMPRASMITP